MADTKIEWAEKVWNPTVGCTPVSAGCKNCYAKRIYERFHPGQSFNQVRCLDERLNDPRNWKKPARVFVDSMSDLFHPNIPNEFISRAFYVMRSLPQHTFMILTKRAERMNTYFRDLYNFWQGQLKILPNLWLGVSVEDQKTADERIPLLLQTPAVVRFVSCEPALEPILLQGWDIPYMRNYLSHRYVTEPHVRGPLDWVIMGCESGPGRRPMRLDWARSMRDQCQEAGVPFFLKQAEIDGNLVKMPELDGKQWAQYPKEIA